MSCRIRVAMRSACAALLAVLAGCGSGERGVTVSRAIDESVYGGGFDFLPPLDSQRALAAFNAAATPVVEIYAGLEAEKTPTTRLLKRFETAEIAVEEGHFQVNWDTGAAEGGLPDGVTNCVIEVWWETSGASELLGYVDCTVDKQAGKAKKSTSPDEYLFCFNDGRTLPCKFAVDVTLPPPVDLAVTGVLPASARQGDSLAVSISGAGFKPGAAVAFSGSGITVLSTNVVSSSELTVSLSLDAAAEVGPRDVTVTNPRNRSATLTAGFEVLPAIVLVERILFGSGVGWETNIWSMNPDGSDQRQLTSLPGREDYPAVTPDGQHILFHHGPEPQADIWMMDADGSNPHPLIAVPGDELAPVVSPEGASVLYTSNRGGSYQQWRYDLATGANQQVTHDSGSAWFGTFTPDGARVYFESYRSGNAAIWSIALDGTGERQHTSVGSDGVRRFPTVSPTGLQVALTYPALALMDPHRVVGGAGILATGASGIKSRAWFSPDGQWIVLTGQSGTTGSRVFKVPAAGPFTATDLIPAGLGVVNNAPFWGLVAQ